MTSRQLEDYLQDILDAIIAAQQFVADMSFEEFISDQKTIFAVTRAIEIVGEATKNIPPSIRNIYPQVQWKSIAGMRDKMIHQYFGVNLRVLWDTVHQDLPTLEPIIAKILKDLSNFQ
ncbi:DUF86 domain-containing protein [Spirulina sp. CS-785/01]|uniref:HepT-like ribonuclease domain-containing protein n=1 Tax=Spirulina sp. CS-785/01 TaxID=3021716 RepID=UPI00233012EB|nr:DUF86 domain-containing protein [Spirulina sp. CS-785/01]MDB9314643.1 DUF86 domain-containing protein [Spirulina sp. CS-785/01]